jgi:hypothetical protein
VIKYRAPMPPPTAPPQSRSIVASIARPSASTTAIIATPNACA